MKKVKLLLCILIVMAIVICITIIVLQKGNNKQNISREDTNKVDNIIEIPDLETKDTFDQSQLENIELVNNKNEYFAVAEIIKKYTSDNYIITSMYVSRIKTNIDVLWVEGVRKDNATVSHIIVITDSMNSTYQIINEETIAQNGYNKDNINKFEITEIQKDGNNSFRYKNINDEEYAKALLTDYIEKALYSPQLAYYLLDEDYRSIKFGTLDEYTRFINSKREELMLYNAKNVKQPGDFSSYEEWMSYFQKVKLLELSKYEIENYNGNTSYIVIDTYDNYYVFQTSSTMNYTVILDSYTVDTEKYLDEYKKADDQEKVEININKVIDAINNDDYKYVYEKLDENFSKNNFSSLSDFETKMKNNFFRKNDVEFDDYNESGEGTHEYSLTITDSTKTDKRNLEVKAIVVLKGDTDYTIKFQ